MKEQLRDPDFKKASRLIENTYNYDALRVGIIGCGRLGSHLAQVLLSFGEVKAQNLHISTRRPETLGVCN